MKKYTNYAIYDFSDYAAEIKENPYAYAAYMSLQGKAKEEGVPDKYKGYNVLGSGKVQVTVIGSNKNDYTRRNDWIWIDSNGENKTTGQTVYSTTSGTVIGCDQNLSEPKGADPNNKGNWVRIQMNDGWIRDYYHLDSITVNI